MQRRDLADLQIAAALAIGAFAVYAAGACRTIYVGDSGELVAAAHTLGIPHPSGYPLYVLAGKAFTLLVPVGSIAFRMSLFSALFAALTVGLLFLVCRALPVERIAAAAAAVAFAASPSFWGEANVQRVYALNAFFVALASLLALRWFSAGGDEKTKARTRSRLFVVLAFACGAGASNHTFLAVWGLAFLAFALAVDRDLWRQWRTLVAAVVAAAAGLSIYLFLLVRSRQQPRLNWSSPDSLEALFGVVTRRDFWQRRWWSGWGDLLPIAGDYLSSFVVELTFVGAALVLVGLWAGFRRRLPVLLFVLVALANLAAMAAHGSRSDLFIWHRYYIPAYLSAAALAAIGLDFLLGLAGRKGPVAFRAATAIGAIALAGALLLVPLRYRDFDRSRYEIAEAYSRRLLASLPPGAHLAASDDNILFVLIYLQLVERVRPDVDLILQGVGGEIPALRFDPDDEPLFFTHHPNWNLAELDVVPAGLVFQVVRRGDAPTIAAAPDPGDLPGESDPRVPKDYLTRNLIGELHFLRAVSAERSDRDRALAELERAAEAAPDNDVLFYNLGLVYERMGLPDRALAAFERSHAINPRAIPGPMRVRAADRIRALRGSAGAL